MVEFMEKIKGWEVQSRIHGEDEKMEGLERMKRLEG